MATLLFPVLLIGGFVWAAACKRDSEERAPKRIVGFRASAAVPRHTPHSAPRPSPDSDSAAPVAYTPPPRSTETDQDRRLRILKALDSTRVFDLTFEPWVTLSDALCCMRTVTGESFVMSAGVREEKGDVVIELAVAEATARRVLDLITDLYEMDWIIRHGVVLIIGKGEDPPARFLKTEDLVSEQQERLHRAIETRLVDLRFEGTSFPQVVAHLSAATGVDFVVDPRVKDELQEAEVSVIADDITVASALELVMTSAFYGGGVAYEIGDNVIRFTKPEKQEDQVGTSPLDHQE